MNSVDRPRVVSDKERRKGRLSFIVLVIIFFAPLVAAWLIYFGAIPWKPSGIKANGELLQPPVLIEVPGQDSQGAQVVRTEVPELQFLTEAQEASLLRDKWALVYVADECESSCEESLVLIRQVRMSLGRYLDRISRALIVTQSPRDVERLTTAFPGMDIVRSDVLAEQILNASGRESGAQIYLVDPLGNLTIMFARDSEPREMYNDLKHLLKLSRIG